MPSVAFMTLGCKVNQTETETMAGLFAADGYTLAEFDEVADVYVINTCSVTHLGEKKSRQMIHRARKQNPAAVIAVTGCYAQTNPEETANIEGVNIVIGTDKRGEIVELLKKARQDSRAIVCREDFSALREFEDIPLTNMPRRTRAFLKIEDGCENFCSYCIIPYARGRVRSRSFESIRREVKTLADNGFLEIVLTGIHLGAYGRDTGENLTNACRAVLDDSRIKRLRLSSLESIELSNKLVDMMASEERFCPHLHLPLQAGSDEILRRMNRHYTSDDFARLIDNVRRQIPRVAISTDLIVGFPGETEELFAESLAFAAKMEFARIHVFPYSPRRNTPAAAMPCQIPPTVKKERVKAVQSIAEESSKKFRRQFLQTTMPVLFETNTDGVTDGLTDNYIRVYTKDNPPCGQFAKAKITGLFEDGVIGEIV